METRSGVTRPIVHLFSPQLAPIPKSDAIPNRDEEGQDSPNKSEIEISEPATQMVFDGNI